jgi:hypothetical protein
MDQLEEVWVFTGEGGGHGFPSGVFIDLQAAERWIRRHSLSGTLTAYPLNTGVYDWVIERGSFRPSKPHQTAPAFIGKFTSAYMQHYHYENGECEERKT